MEVILDISIYNENPSNLHIGKLWYITDTLSTIVLQVLVSVFPFLVISRPQNLLELQSKAIQILKKVKALMHKE